MLQQINGKTILISRRPVIGSKFNGPAQFLDTPNRSTWEVMPTMTNNEVGVQSVLLDKRKPALKVDPRMIIESKHAA